MAVAQHIDAATYERLVAEGQGRGLELRDGMLVEKPPVSYRHAWTIDGLAADLVPQLDRSEFVVSIGNARLLVTGAFLVPDLAVVPTATARSLLERTPRRAAVYADPVPLVVEVWSPSTGAYDVATKLPLYRGRGDRELWFVHPYERTLTAWVRQADGSYRESVFPGGIVASAALPGVRVDLGALLA